jgi:hypothetical protein
MSLALTTTHENCSFQRSIRWFSETAIGLEDSRLTERFQARLDD